MMKLGFLGCVLSVTACLPQPKSEVQKVKAELVVEGRALPSGEGLSGLTAIFIELESAAEAMSDEDGRFAFTLDEERLQALRLKYGLQDPLLHLYLTRESGPAKSLVLNTLNIENRGTMNLGEVQLRSETSVTGRVLAQGTPVAEARVRLGRRETVTAADGSFALTVPTEVATPLLVSRQGFVQTRGSWLAGAETRTVELYSELTPMGSIEAQPLPRSGLNETIFLSYSANGPSRWIRFAHNSELLKGPYVADAPWQDLRLPLQIVASGQTIYYQFADRDQKILGPVLSYTPSAE